LSEALEPHVATLVPLMSEPSRFIAAAMPVLKSAADHAEAEIRERVITAVQRLMMAAARSLPPLILSSAREAGFDLSADDDKQFDDAFHSLSEALESHVTKLVPLMSDPPRFVVTAMPVLKLAANHAEAEIRERVITAARRLMAAAARSLPPLIVAKAREAGFDLSVDDEKELNDAFHPLSEALEPHVATLVPLMSDPPRFVVTAMPVLKSAADHAKPEIRKRGPRPCSV
jgi:hypothetical protein